MAKETQIKEQIKNLIRDVSFELEDLCMADDTDKIAVLKLFRIISPLNIKALSIKDSFMHILQVIFYIT